MLQFNDLLDKHGIDPKTVLVFRHCPTAPQLKKVLPWLAAERPEVFNAYQQTQGKIVEKAMQRAKYVASFIGHEPGKALFVGLYAVGGSTPMTPEQYCDNKENKELKSLGAESFTADSMRSSILWFELKLSDCCAKWKGRLIIEWPGKELSWWRWSDRNGIPVLAIVEDSALVECVPKKDDIDLEWKELSRLPASWKSALSQWRGIYYIFDSSDRKAYVGSAYGQENLWGRWLTYANSGHGDNSLLRDRDPLNFRFTILQLVSPDMDKDEVISLETSWKKRLHTRHPYGLNDN